MKTKRSVHLPWDFSTALLYVMDLANLHNIVLKVSAIATKGGMKTSQILVFCCCNLAAGSFWNTKENVFLWRRSSTMLILNPNLNSRSPGSKAIMFLRSMKKALTFLQFSVQACHIWIFLIHNFKRSGCFLKYQNSIDLLFNFLLWFDCLAWGKKWPSSQGWIFLIRTDFRAG